MLAALTLAPATTLDYTGLPQLAAPTPYEIRGHSATIRVEGDRVTVESTTEYRNRGEAGTATVLVPRRRNGDETSGQPTFPVDATWDKRPIRLLPVASRGTSETTGPKQVEYRSDLSAKVPFGKQATHALRLRVTLPLGKTGATPPKALAGYLLEGGVPFGVLNLSFKYGPPTVFNLPDVMPAGGWQVGTHGAFLRRANTTPNGELAGIAFYKGGFKNREP